MGFTILPPATRGPGWFSTCIAPARGRYLRGSETKARVAFLVRLSIYLGVLWLGLRNVVVREVGGEVGGQWKKDDRRWILWHMGSTSRRKRKR